MWIFSIFSRSKWTIWSNYRTTGKSGQGWVLPLSMALLAYRNKKPWCKFFQYFLGQNWQFGQTTELQENTDRGHIDHCPWLYWPTWIINLDVNFFNIFSVKMESGLLLPISLLAYRNKNIYENFLYFLGQIGWFGLTTELQEHLCTTQIYTPNLTFSIFSLVKCLSNKSTYSSCPTILHSGAVNFCFGIDRELCKKYPSSFWTTVLHQL